jgi:hypothetical protein
MCFFNFLYNFLLILRRIQRNIIINVQTWSDNKVHELATVCLLWQHWTKALVGFDDV